tara:strand:- start:2670 stop:3557 length:888 start_codon:yes stop_codon:yes gene_type:complete
MALSKPNFFIIGAPKCGTTSLYNYLNSHSQITMSHPKEPHYFSKDIENGGIRNKEKYIDCFSHGKRNAIAIGESSTLYLYSKVAVQNIYNYSRDAKFITMIRNPIEIARSFHQVALKVFGEIETDFQKAWLLEDNRKSGMNIPIGCIDPKLILYGDIAKLGQQVKRLLSKISSDKIHFVLYDDFKSSTESEYIKVLNFLNVDIELPHCFSSYNKTHRIKNEAITKITNYGSALKKKMNIKTKFNIADKIHKMNITDDPLDYLPENFLLKMENFFKYDTILLSRLIKKDLSKWRIS